MNILKVGMYDLSAGKAGKTWPEQK
jgi:hypothetical protein